VSSDKEKGGGEGRLSRFRVAAPSKLPWWFSNAYSENKYQKRQSPWEKKKLSLPHYKVGLGRESGPGNAGLFLLGHCNAREKKGIVLDLKKIDLRESLPSPGRSAPGEQGRRRSSGLRRKNIGGSRKRRAVKSSQKPRACRWAHPPCSSAGIGQSGKVPCVRTGAPKGEKSKRGDGKTAYRAAVKRTTLGQCNDKRPGNWIGKGPLLSQHGGR